jgi:hypothetical protein
MEDDHKPCCAADALRRIRQVTINGLPTGITMLGEIIEEVKSQDLHSDPELQAALLKRVKVYNYVPRNVEEVYANVLLEEFRKQVART